MAEMFEKRWQYSICLDKDRCELAQTDGGDTMHHLRELCLYAARRGDIATKAHWENMQIIYRPLASPQYRAEIHAINPNAAMRVSQWIDSVLAMIAEAKLSAFCESSDALAHDCDQICIADSSMTWNTVSIIDHLNGVKNETLSRFAFKDGQGDGKSVNTLDGKTSLAWTPSNLSNVQYGMQMTASWEQLVREANQGNRMPQSNDKFPNETKRITRQTKAQTSRRDSSTSFGGRGQRQVV